MWRTFRASTHELHHDLCMYARLPDPLVLGPTRKMFGVGEWRKAALPAVSLPTARRTIQRTSANGRNKSARPRLQPSHVRQRLDVSGSSRFRRSGKAPRKQNQCESLPMRRFCEAGLRTDFTQMSPEMWRRHRAHHDDRESQHPLPDLTQRFRSIHRRLHHITQHYVHAPMTEDV